MYWVVQKIYAQLVLDSYREIQPKSESMYDNGFWSLDVRFTSHYSILIKIKNTGFNNVLIYFTNKKKIIF